MENFKLVLCAHALNPHNLRGFYLIYFFFWECLFIFVLWKTLFTHLWVFTHILFPESVESWIKILFQGDIPFHFPWEAFLSSLVSSLQTGEKLSRFSPNFFFNPLIRETFYPLIFLFWYCFWGDNVRNYLPIFKNHWFFWITLLKNLKFA
jgi:hypothetical protein